MTKFPGFRTFASPFAYDVIRSLLPFRDIGLCSFLVPVQYQCHSVTLLLFMRLAVCYHSALARPMRETWLGTWTDAAEHHRHHIIGTLRTDSVTPVTFGSLYFNCGHVSVQYMWQRSITIGQDLRICSASAFPKIQKFGKVSTCSSLSLHAGAASLKSQTNVHLKQIVSWASQSTKQYMKNDPKKLWCSLEFWLLWLKFWIYRACNWARVLLYCGGQKDQLTARRDHLRLWQVRLLLHEAGMFDMICLLEAL